MQSAIIQPFGVWTSTALIERSTNDKHSALISPDNCHVLLAACSNIFHLLKSADDNLDSMVIQGRCHQAWASLDMWIDIRQICQIHTNSLDPSTCLRLTPHRRIDTNLELWILVEHGAVSALSCTFREAPDFWVPECDQR
ncbi:hypothetical protein FOCG_10504 [Fusarium oxysporum f. sp. radicis-lycopersici 26381]|nr:hypothetical protein FOWG_05504 [Fusarium oxysporum f. sp. lycopersici MN25]EXL48000.1 hypothetical protein FOCG_10504 [Fusarium oxysporum f. sp. radicis-lycopersici 26381]